VKKEILSSSTLFFYLISKVKGLQLQGKHEKNYESQVFDGTFGQDCLCVEHVCNVTKVRAVAKIPADRALMNNY